MKKTIIIMYMIVLLTFMSMSYLVYGATSDPTILGVSVVNQNPDPAIAGDVVEVRLGIENGGGAEATAVIVEIIPSYPFQIVAGDSLVQNAGTIGAYQGSEDIKILKYRLQVNKDASAGTYELAVKLSTAGSVSSITKTVLLTVKGGTNAEIIHIDKTILIPGQQSSINFKINNVGNSPLRDLTFSWENTDKVILPVGSDNTRYVKYIDVGESADLEYQVVADTNVVAGLYQLNLYLTYDSATDNIKKEISTIAGVYVGGGTDFDVAFSDSSTGTTSFTIANIGSNPATSVSINIPEQKGWRVTGSNSVIIGNLNKGDYTVASFKLQSQAASFVNRTSGKNMNYSNSPTTNTDSATNSASPDSMIMQISYTDTMGLRTIVNKSIKIGMQNLGSSNQTGTYPGAYGPRGTTKPSNGISSIWYIAGAVVLIVAGFFVYRRYSKQKLLSPNANIKDVFKTKKK